MDRSCCVSPVDSFAIPSSTGHSSSGPSNASQLHSGFTLLELLVVLVIVSIIYSTGIPAAWNWVLDAHQRTAANVLMTHLQMARNSAISRHRNVVLCPSVDGKTCTDSNNWQPGWIIFTDPNDNKHFDGSDTLLTVQQALGKPIQIHFGGRNGGRYVRYTALGRGWPNATFTFCDQRGSAAARAIVLSLSGRPRMDGVSSSGKPLHCDSETDSD